MPPERHALCTYRGRWILTEFCEQKSGLIPWIGGIQNHYSHRAAVWNSSKVTRLILHSTHQSSTAYQAETNGWCKILYEFSCFFSLPDVGPAACTLGASTPCTRSTVDLVATQQSWPAATSRGTVISCHFHWSRLHVRIDESEWKTTRLFSFNTMNMKN